MCIIKKLVHDAVIAIQRSRAGDGDGAVPLAPTTRDASMTGVRARVVTGALGAGRARGVDVPRWW